MMKNILKNSLNKEQLKKFNWNQPFYQYISYFNDCIIDHINLQRDIDKRNILKNIQSQLGIIQKNIEDDNLKHVNP